jgi:hypothetical protein
MNTGRSRGVDHRTIIPLRYAAETLACGIAELTGRLPAHTVSLGDMLRRNTAVLAETFAAEPLDTGALKNAYDLAHDAEYILFFLLFARYVSRPDVPGLFEQIYDMKRLIVAAVE